ncbi:MAG: carboxylesterase family protein [Clostridia bacterium]|nr:carboxylesterase family protein [Clostridia bacterium]
MKKWITIDAFIVAFFSAMGYGFGYSIPAVLNAPAWLCLIICIAGGMVMDEIASKIIYSRFTQEKVWRKLLVFAAFIVIFLIGNAVSTKCLDESLFDGLKEEWSYVLIFAVLGFATSLVKRHYKTVKVKARYGEGEEGFRFNAEEKAYMEGLNGKNAEITGKYDSALAAKTRTGVYVGVKEDSVLSFNGIPYAKAPIGTLRWKAPEKLPDSDKVFEAKYFGASSIQVNYEGNPLSSHQQSEDCLTLNVCTAELAPKEKKPVIVYFHGGDFTYGGSADPLWEMSNFVQAHPDVVAVSFNYRLGLLGFIDFSAIPGGEDYPDAANLGLLDQIAALEWVKENIAAFGGDAERITVMGDSAGGTSISLLSACKRVSGLFKKAIVFSGSPYEAVLHGMDSAVLASELLKAAGAVNMKELLALSEEKLSHLTQQLKARLGTPRCDGELIPADIFEAYTNGGAKDVPFILCTSRDNANVYGASIGRGLSEDIITESTEKILKRQKPEAAQALRGLIGEETKRIGKAKAEAEFINLWTEQAIICYVSKLLLAGGGDARLLYWDVDAEIKNLGVGDVSLVSTVLGNSETAVSYGNVVNENISEILQALMMKAVHGEEPEFYNNEIEGVSAIKWETYPSVLAVSKNKIQLQAAEDTLTDAREMLLAAGLEG